VCSSDLEAYVHVPPPIFKEFTKTIEELDLAVDIVIDALGGAIEADMPDMVNEICKAQSQELMMYIDRLSAIINGTGHTSEDDQSDGVEDQVDSVEYTQATAEALFD